MLKKIIFFGLILSFSSFSSFAKNDDSTLVVSPDNPSAWGYIGAIVMVNNNSAYPVGSGTTIPLSVNDGISLTVYAMNVKPKLDTSCENIKISAEGRHYLSFELQGDWLIHCRYR